MASNAAADTIMPADTRFDSTTTLGSYGDTDADISPANDEKIPSAPVTKTTWDPIPADRRGANIDFWYIREPNGRHSAVVETKFDVTRTPRCPRQTIEESEKNKASLTDALTEIANKTYEAYEGQANPFPDTVLAVQKLIPEAAAKAYGVEGFTWRAGMASRGAGSSHSVGMGDDPRPPEPFASLWLDASSRWREASGGTSGTRRTKRDETFCGLGGLVASLFRGK